jgi:Pyridoxamine 5'-phosphate oxidase
VGRDYDEIDQRLADWIGRQSLFFVGTAPIAADGHVNVSPKGPIGSFRVLGPHRVAYLDLVGSGAETIAHVRENGRIVIMFCAFEGPPKILRLHGTGAVQTPEKPRFAELAHEFEQPAHGESRRAIIEVEVTRIADSCGYGVPVMNYRSRRPHLDAWASKKLRVGGPSALMAYKRDKNSSSIDELPALDL